MSHLKPETTEIGEVYGKNGLGGGAKVENAHHILPIRLPISVISI